MQNITSKLKEKVEARLRQDARVRDFPIDVFDNNGVVTLQGEVPSEKVSTLAEELARQVEGVIHVTNELYIKQV
jgi:osmotically-inducible protein OsmY